MPSPASKPAVRDIEVELARLTFLKDMLIAEYEGKSSKWQAFQGAALARGTLAFMASASGAISAAAAGVVLGVAGGAILLAHLALDHHEGRAEDLLGRLLRDMETLKGGGGPK